MRKQAASIFAIAALGLSITACGNNEHSKAEPAPQKTVVTEESAPTKPLYNESDVVKYLHLFDATKDPNDKYYLGDWVYFAPDKTACAVSQVFTDGDQARYYLEEGSDVAITPEGNVGVEVVDPEIKTCMPLVTKALEGFEASQGGN
jgi:hypothetical protein